MPPDEPNEEERLEKLPGDYDTPYRPADGGRDPDADPDDERQVEEHLDDTHPITDTDVDQQEMYDQGVSSLGTEPNAGDSVINYDPPEEDKD